MHNPDVNYGKPPEPPNLSVAERKERLANIVERGLLTPKQAALIDIRDLTEPELKRCAETSRKHAGTIAPYIAAAQHFLRNTPSEFLRPCGLRWPNRPETPRDAEGVEWVGIT